MLGRTLQFAHRGAMGLASRARNIYLRQLGVRIGGYCWLRAIRVPQQWEDVTLEAGVSLDEGVTLLCSGERRPDKLLLHRGVYVNRFTLFDAHVHIEVGADVMIGPYCYLTDADHGIARNALVRTQSMKMAPVIIGEGAWIGAGVQVLKGVRIGQGAVVGAGSVVTRDVADFHIAVGVPAKSIGERS